MLKLINNTGRIILRNEPNILSSFVGASLIHTSAMLEKLANSHNRSSPKKWVENNKVIFEPQNPEEEEKRPAFVCHMKSNIRYSPKKMWYIATFVRGMSVDEAIKQLSFVLKKGAAAVKETLLEAQEMAVKQHNVEYKSNLWISESFCGKGQYFKGLRRHAKGRVGRVEYKHCHYFVKLEEGKPPKQYYLPYSKTPDDQLEEWIDSMRRRKITNSL